MIEKLMHELHESGGRDKKGNPRPLSASTVRSIAGLLSSILNSARRWELIASNPVEVIQLPRRRKKEQGVLDHAEFERLLDRARSSWIAPLLAVAGATGCRRGELLALTWADVDFDAGAVLISKSLEQTRQGLRIKSTKGRRARAFHLPGSAVAILRELREEQGREAERLGDVYRRDLNLVFGNATGEYRNPGSVSAMARRILQSAGFQGVSLHNLRHSHGSQLIDAGVPITDVSERLGHANPSITMSIYAHALKSKQRDAADKWEEAAARARRQTPPPD
jgi:integrase